MVEYGNGVGQGTGAVSGSGGGGGGGGDWGAAIGQFATDTADTVSAMPPAQLLLIVVAILLGLVVLKRAF